MLLERERVLLALAHQETDRAPADFWATPEEVERLLQYFSVPDYNTLLNRLEIDIREVRPDYIGPQGRTLPDGTHIAANGIHYRRVENAFCAYNETVKHPLADFTTPDEIINYPHWPKPEWYDWSSLSDKIGGLHDRYFVKIEMGGLFESINAMRGMEQVMIDMATEPEMMHAAMQSIAKSFTGFIQKALDAAGNKIDLVYTFDDIASQRGLLMSPAMWEEFIAPYHRSINKVIKSYGKCIMYHSCGAVYDMIARLAALPIDILNPLQPQAVGMDFVKIKQNFGGKLCFHGGIDIQGVLPHGTWQETAQAALDTREILGKDGGYILASSHYIQADTPPENVDAMYLANKLGHVPESLTLKKEAIL